MPKKTRTKSAKTRADLLMVDHGLAETRERAQALIMEGLVYSPTGKVLKPGTALPGDLPLEVRGRLPYVGRGGVKLAHALDRFGLDVAGLVALDVGASTGGFTDCLLQRGAELVYALDVGHGQIDYRLRQDPRVVVMEGVNARYDFDLPPGPRGNREQGTRNKQGVPPVPRSSFPVPGVEGRVELATIDVSFISATRVIPSTARHLKQGSSIVLLLKPQFEALRGEVGRGGVIKDPALHARVLGRFVRWLVETDFRLRDLTPSPILGDASNREFFLWLEK